MRLNRAVDRCSFKSIGIADFTDFTISQRTLLPLIPVDCFVAQQNDQENGIYFRQFILLQVSKFAHLKMASQSQHAQHCAACCTSLILSEMIRF